MTFIGIGGSLVRESIVYKTQTRCSRCFVFSLLIIWRAKEILGAVSLSCSLVTLLPEQRRQKLA